MGAGAIAVGAVALCSPPSAFRSREAHAGSCSCVRSVRKAHGVWECATADVAAMVLLRFIQMRNGLLVSGAALAGLVARRGLALAKLLHPCRQLVGHEIQPDAVDFQPVAVRLFYLEEGCQCGSRR